MTERYWTLHPPRLLFFFLNVIFKSDAFALELLALSAFRNLSYLYFVIYLFAVVNNCSAGPAWLQGALLACPGKDGWGQLGDSKGPPAWGPPGSTEQGSSPGPRDGGEDLQGKQSPLLFHLLKSHFSAPQLMCPDLFPSVIVFLIFAIAWAGEKIINQYAYTQYICVYLFYIYSVYVYLYILCGYYPRQIDI